MKYKIISTLIIIILMMIGITPDVGRADAYEANFTTSIVYQNIGSATTQTLEVYFYDSPSDTTPTVVGRPNLNKGGGTSLFVGSLSSLDNGFQGSAVLSADQPLAATAVQLPQQSPTVQVYPLSNGFSSGTAVSLIPTVLKNTYNQNTRFTVQNTASSSVQITVKFINTSAATVYSFTQTLQPYAGVNVDAGQVSQLGSAFNGSVRVETPGSGYSIVSSAMELDYGPGRVGASAFEGVGSGATKIYMPSALCENYGMHSAYAVQNTDLSSSTNVTVTYSNGASETKNILPGAKASFLGCNKLPAGFLGSAVITSDSKPVIAVGKISGNGASTAFIGFASGSQKVALPYVRYANDFNFYTGYMPRTNIAIQNVGSATITGDIKVHYIDRNGAIVGTHTITTDVPPEIKVNSHAGDAGLIQFGCYNNCTEYGGSVVIEGPAGSQLAVIARNSVYLNDLYYCEDYNGITTTISLP